MERRSLLEFIIIIFVFIIFFYLFFLLWSKLQRKTVINAAKSFFIYFTVLFAQDDYQSGILWEVVGVCGWEMCQDCLDGD